MLFDPVKKYYDPHPDPPRSKKPDLILITHGHTDHSNDIASYPPIKKIMHAATAEILRYRYKIIKGDIILEKMAKPGEIEDIYMPIKYKNLKIEAFNAGHTIGSVQFKVTGKEGSLVFTGDANSIGTTVMRPAPILEADVLAIEATMGHPSLVTPSRAESFQIINDFLEGGFSDGNDMVVMFGNSIGKGQEITKMVNSLDIGIKKELFVENRTFDINGIYEKYMIPLGTYKPLSAMDGKSGKKVVFMDVNKLVGSSKLTGAKMFKMDTEPPSMIVSIFGHGYEKQFQQLKMSSHDDWNGLNNYVEKSINKNGGKVAVFHGFSKEFSRHLKRRGYDSIDAHAEILDA